MTPLSINDYLNEKNPWSARLLGLTDFKKNRTIEQVENEYNLDKYAKLLEFDLKTAEAYKSKEFELSGYGPNSSISVSFGDEIFTVPLAKARESYYKLMKEYIHKYDSENLCELGCGYGFNLSLFNHKTYGGEYSRNAVKIGQRLGLDISEFNYYQPEDYRLIRANTTVFTTHSIEQIPDANIIIRSLETQKHNINYVVHFEPTIVEERSSLFGLLRNKYIQLNDYNRNLIEVLKNNPAIEILELRNDVFGLSPLNSTNLIVWKFRK